MSEGAELPREVLLQLVALANARSLDPARVSLLDRVRLIEVAGAHVLLPGSWERVSTHAAAMMGAWYLLPRGRWRDARVRFTRYDVCVIETSDGRIGAGRALGNGLTKPLEDRSPATLQQVRLALAERFPNDPPWPEESIAITRMGTKFGALTSPHRALLGSKS